MAQPWARAFYLSKLWRQQRQHALNRDQIQLCGLRRSGAEGGHHIVELTPQNITDYNVALNLDNLVCLCFDCHQKRHRGNGDVMDGFVFDEAGSGRAVSPRGSSEQHTPGDITKKILVVLERPEKRKNGCCGIGREFIYIEFC